MSICNISSAQVLFAPDDSSFYQKTEIIHPEVQKETRHKRSSNKKNKNAVVADSAAIPAEFDFNADTSINNIDTAQSTHASEIKAEEHSRKRDKKLIEKDTSRDVPEVTDPPPPIQLTPDQTAEIFLNTGIADYTGSKFLDAIASFDSIIILFPQSPSYNLAYYYRAISKIPLNDQAGALQDINKFILADNCTSDLCTDAYYTRGLLKLRSSQYNEAVEDFSKPTADSTFRNYKFAFFYRGLCYSELNNYIAAVQDFTKFINLDNYKTIASAEALYNRAFNKVKLHDNRGAIKDYDHAIELYALAVQSVKNANNYLDKLIETYIERGLAKAEISKYEEAIEDYTQVIKLKPANATAFRLRGLAKIGKGMLDDGCLDLSKAGEIGSLEAYEDIKQKCK